MTSEGKSRRAAAPAPPPARVRRRRSRGGLGDLFNLDSEQSARLLLIGAVGLVALIAVGFIAFGYWYSVVKPRQRTVLQVDDVKVSYSAMKRRMEYEYFQNVVYQQAAQILGEATYQQVLNELTQIKRAGSSLGVTFTPEELDAKLRSKIGVAAESDQRAFAEALRTALETSGLKESEYRRIVEAELYEEKIKAKFTAELPASVLQAKLEVIQTTTRADAQSAIDRITFGEDFGTVARALSQESDVQTTGGVHDYGPEGTFPSAYDGYAFTGEVGKLSAPIDANGVFYVVRVVDRSEQPVKEEQKSGIVESKFSDWLQVTQDEMLAANAIKDNWDEQDQTDALTAIIPDLQKRQLQQAEDRRKQQEAAATAAALQPSPVITIDASQGTAQATAAATAPAEAVTPSVPNQPVAPGTNGQ